MGVITTILDYYLTVGFLLCLAWLGYAVVGHLKTFRSLRNVDSVMVCITGAVTILLWLPVLWFIMMDIVRHYRSLTPGHWTFDAELPTKSRQKD